MTERKSCSVGDLLEHRCPRFGLVRQWRVKGIHLGGMHQESVVHLESVSHIKSEEGPLIVPEALTRSLEIVFRAPRQ